MKEELPGSTFVKLGRLLRNSFQAEFRVMFGDEIAPSESRILGFIVARPGTSGKEICEAFELTKSTGSEILSSLQQKGFIEVRPSSTDRRQKPLFATAKGEEMERKTIAALIAHDARLFADVSEEELQVAKAILEKVSKRMKGESHGK